MKIPIYQVDAFTDAVFAGNPAAVCPLDDWLSDEMLQGIALENNLSETAFLVANGGDYHLRWFTPAVEVALCGHATLGAAHVIFKHLKPDTDQVVFDTLSGKLTVRRENGRLSMDFPSLPPQPMDPRPDVRAALGGPEPQEFHAIRSVHGADYLMLVYGNRDQVAALAPNFSDLKANVIATAEAGTSDNADFVSRFFAPMAGIDEDPVTGSAHCTLAPYWIARLGRSPLQARQISARGGDVTVELDGDRVRLSRRCADYMSGEITL